MDKLDEKSKLPQSLKVVLGEHDLLRKDETFLETKEFRVKNVFVHEEYVLRTDVEGDVLLMQHDIALLELEEEVDLSVYTPVCLPSSVRNRDNTPALTMGKGRVYLILISIGNCAKLNPLVYGIFIRTFPDHNYNPGWGKTSLFIEPEEECNKTG